MPHDGPFDPSTPTRQRGDEAEEAAVRWLTGQGYRILERNAANKAGELDVVAADGEILCFVEIKARSGKLFGPAIAAVTPRKQRRLARIAALYLARKPWPGPCRFDVLGMDAEDDGGWRFTLIRDAFEVAPGR